MTMSYWTEMESKHGFDDGRSIPADANTYRKVALEIVNALATKLGSERCMIAYDRPDAHNRCMVLCIDRYNPQVKEVSQDIAMQRAVDIMLNRFDPALGVVVEPDIDEEYVRCLLADIEDTPVSELLTALKTKETKMTDTASNVKGRPRRPRHVEPGCRCMDRHRS
jgi:hypothetical protein